MKAQAAAALESTPPGRTTAAASPERAGVRLAVHQAISPQDLAAGARISAKRGAQILRLEAEAAAKRAAARELEEVRGAIRADVTTISAPPDSLAQSPAEGNDVAAASTMAAWASKMRSRMADKDNKLAQVRAELTEERGKATNNSIVHQAQAVAAARQVEELTAQLAAAKQEIAHLRVSLSESTQRNDCMESEREMVRQENGVKPDLVTPGQQEFARLRQRCEAAEQMLWLTEKKSQADQEAYVVLDLTFSLRRAACLHAC